MSVSEAKDPRFAPGARRELGQMFSEVRPRYDLLNALLSLGQDRAWRRALWDQVPEQASVVLDACCGNGVSTLGLRRPGRIVLGVDASRDVLREADDRCAGRFGAPRFARGDCLRLPLRDRSVDAVVIAFGLRNLRPRRDALRELVRVLRPGGRLAILEAAAPRPGPFAPLHRAYLGLVVPALGLFSPQPDAYRYLARSILVFGDGRDLPAEMGAAGLAVRRERAFLMGATRLWTADRLPGPGDIPPAPTVHNATTRSLASPHRILQRQRDREWRWWRSVLLACHLAVLGFLISALAGYGTFVRTMGLPDGAAWGGRVLLWAGTLLFGLRSVALAARLRYPPEGR